VSRSSGRGAFRGRLLYVTANFPRWSGDAVPPYTIHLARDLQASGWRVDVLAPHAPGAARSETVDGIHVERFRYLLPEAAQTVCYGSGSLVNLEDRRQDLAKVPLLVAAQLASVARRLLSGRYDLVNSHWALPQAFTTTLVARLAGVPHVATCHGEEFHVLRGRALLPFKRIGLRAADVVTVNSRSTEAALRTQVPGVRSVRRIPMGVTTDVQPDPALVRSLRARHLVGNGPLVMFTGRHVDDKGVDDLLRAIPLVASRLPDVRAIIAGDGRDRETFEKLAAELGVTDRVWFPGWVPDVDLPSYYAAADVFVAPSRPGRTGFIEGQGLTPLEAMIFGTPVVATTFGGYADIIHHERTALAVPGRAPDAIASAIERIAVDRNLAESLTSTGATFAVENYSRRSVADRFTDLFDELIARPRQHRRERVG